MLLHLLTTAHGTLQLDDPASFSGTVAGMTGQDTIDFANIDPSVVSLSGAIDEARAPKPVSDAISALVNLGYGQPQAAAAIAAATRTAGDKAETAQLIRLGLKELAK